MKEKTTTVSMTCIAMFCYLLGICTVPAFANDPLQIVFQKSANVETKDVRLGDIVHFNYDDDTTKALSELIVADAPQPGERLLLRSVKIRNMLLRTKNIPHCKWRGSATVSVLRRGVAIDREKILSHIDNYLKKNTVHIIKEVNTKVSFIPKTVPETFFVPTGRLTCEVIPSHPNILRSKRFALIFRIGSQVVKNISVIGTIQAEADVVISATSLKRGEQLQRNHLSTITMNIANIPNAITDVQDLLGTQMRHPLRAGEPVLVNMVEAVPLIKKDDPVKIIIQSGAMLLSANGHAITNGALNQIIRVRNNSSKKILNARVLAPGSVEIVLQ